MDTIETKFKKILRQRDLANVRMGSEKGLHSLAILTLIFVSIPLFYLLVRALQKPLPEIVELIFRTKTLEVLVTTTTLLVAVVALTALIGILIASGIFFVRLRWAFLLIIPVILPLAIPSYVFTYTWISVIPGFSGLAAAIYILTLSTLPYTVLAITISLRGLDVGLIEVARSLGLSKKEIFFRVVLPHIRPAISAGSILTGLYVLSDFGAVSLLNVETLTVNIQNLFKSSYDRSGAAVISLLLILASTLFIWLESRFKRVDNPGNSTRRSDVKNLRIGSAAIKWSILSLVGVYVFAAVIVPLSVLLTRFASNFSSIDFASLFSALVATVMYSSMGAILALMFSIPLGLLISRSHSKFSSFTEHAILVLHALPGVVVGLALVSLGSKLGPIYQSAFLLAFAYSLLFLAKSVASMSQSMQLIAPGLREVAASLGKSKFGVTRYLVLPLAFPSIGLGALLVFLTAMKELPATLMLRPIGVETLATQIWSFASISRFNEAAPYALLLIIVAAIPTFMLSFPQEIQSARDVRRGGTR
jgi:iron(III) transport system permease protein